MGKSTKKVKQNEEDDTIRKRMTQSKYYNPAGRNAGFYIDNIAAWYTDMFGTENDKKKLCNQI
jgi:hypothetical protein